MSCKFIGLFQFFAIYSTWWNPYRKALYRLQRIVGRLPFARKIRLEWNACNGTGFSWLTLNRSAGPR